MKNNMPYVARIAQAIMAGDKNAGHAVYQEAVEKISDDCEKLIRSYSLLDLPIVLATMEIVAEDAKSMLDSGGLGLMNSVKNNTTCIRVDADGFRRQMGDDHGE